MPGACPSGETGVSKKFFDNRLRLVSQKGNFPLILFFVISRLFFRNRKK
jgi:hypothetical protein